MTTFDALRHPRATDGRFTVRPLEDPGTDAYLGSVGLSAADAARNAEAVRIARTARSARVSTLVEASAAGDAEVRDRILSELTPARRALHAQRIAEAVSRAQWLSQDPAERAYEAGCLPDADEITSLASPEEYRDFEGVDFDAYGEALMQAWEAESRRLSLAAIEENES